MTTPLITILNIGYLRGDLAEWYGLPPGHRAATGGQKCAVQCFHLALPGRSVLVDAASLDLSPEDADMALPGPHPPPLAEQLAAAGAGAVTDVVNTHSHFDHINGRTRLLDGRRVPAFPNARHYLGAGDWDPANFDALQKNTLAVVEQAGLLRLVHGPLDLGDGLDIVPAPGETPGHQLLHWQGDGQEAYFAGDLFHHPLEFDEPERNVVWAEPLTMQASKAMLAERASGAERGAARGARVYFTHIEGPCLSERDAEGHLHWRPA